MKEKCYEHGNNPEMICLYPSCKNRLMCLLCEHNHEVFVTMKKNNKVDLKIFSKRVDKQIDKSLAIFEELESGGVGSQQSKIQEFYDNIKQDLNNMLEIKKKENVHILNQTSNTGIDLLVKARIKGKYYDLPQQSFQRVKHIWEGMDLATLAVEEKRIALETAYESMANFHTQCKQLFQKFHVKLKCQVPQIRLSQSKAQKSVFQNYDEDLPLSKLRQKLVKQVKVNESVSLLSDCYSGKSQIMTIGFDKILRVYDKNLNLLAENQFQNILMRLMPIAPQIFALGVSKQLHIVKISESNQYKMEKVLMMRGHSQRIIDIHPMNSRILASCSEQGTKIWDLYKEKCEYSIKQTSNPSCLNFMPNLKNLAIAYYSNQIKVYTLQKIRHIRLYEISQAALCMSRQNMNQNLFYCGGFKSSLRLFDIRLTKEVFNKQFKSEAITCLRQSIFEQQSILLGERNGKVRIFDLRKQKTRLQWIAHEGMTNLSRPNGIVSIFQQSLGQIVTAGCNDQQLSMWVLEGE